MRNAGPSIATIAGIVILAGAGSVWAQDWPQWRGPNRDGKLSGFVAPQSWPKELTQKWKVTVGVGDSSPALVGNKLYTVGRQEDKEVISCIDAVAGKAMGTLAIKVVKKEGQFVAESVWTNSDTQAGSTFTTPVLRDGLLFGYAATELLCLSAETGKVLWADTAARGQSAAIVDAGSCLIALTVNGELSVYLPSDKRYMELAHYRVGEPEIWAHPVVTGKSIFIRDKESVTLWAME